MKLQATIGFIHPSRFNRPNILECDTKLIADEAFGKNDCEKQAYALKLMDAEIQAAVQRVNDRLKSEGLTKECFILADPRYDEYGNPRHIEGQGWTTDGNEKIVGDRLVPREVKPDKLSPTRFIVS